MSAEQHNEIQRSLGRIEGHQEEIIERLNKINGKIIDHDIKIDKLKTAQTTTKVQLGMIATGASLVIAFIFKFVNDRWG